MALLAILALLVSFVLLGLGSSSSSITDQPLPKKAKVVKCSKRMSTDTKPGPRCGPPPANP